MSKAVGKSSPSIVIHFHSISLFITKTWVESMIPIIWTIYRLMNALRSRKCMVKSTGVSEHTKQPIQSKMDMVRRNDENMDEFK